MSNLQALALKRKQIIAQIGELGPMRPGSICQKKNKYIAKDGSLRINGPYSILTFKGKGNKTQTIHLRSPEEVEMAKKQIDNFKKYQELTKELARISRQIADLELAGESEGKKNSSSGSKRSRKEKRKRSSDD